MSDTERVVGGGAIHGSHERGTEDEPPGAPARSLAGAGGGAGQTVLRARAAATATEQKSPKRAGRSRSVAALSEGKAFRRSLAE